MTDKKIQGLNYNTHISVNDLDFLENSYADLFTDIVKAMMGSYVDGEGFYGILDRSNPRNASPNNTADVRALQVDLTDTADSTSPYVTVNAGSCITKSGKVLTLPAAYDYEVFPTGSIYSDGTTQFIVYVEYELINDPDNVDITKYDYYTSKRKIINTAMVKAVLLDTWNNTTLFPATTKENIVAVAVVSYVFLGGLLTNRVIDLTALYSEDVRPWFSPVDVDHRLDVGTGSASTPHRIGLNDLSQGTVTLYDQLLNKSSAVISKPKDVANCCGVLCTETLGPINLKTDTIGTMTGIINAKYFELSKFPSKLVGAYNPNVSALEEDNNDIAVSLLPRTNILLVAPDESIPPTVTVEYTASETAVIDLQSTKSGGVELTIKDVVAGDIAVAGGMALTELNTLKYNFVGSVLFPQLFKLYLDSNGDPVASPQMLCCGKQTTAIGTTLQNNTAVFYTDGKLIARAYSSALTSFNLNVTLNGLDADGNSITEVVYLTYQSTDQANSTIWPPGAGGIWSPVSNNLEEIDTPIKSHLSTTGTTYRTNDLYNYWLNPAAIQEMGNGVETYNTFSSLTSWSIDTVNPDVYIAIYVNIDPVKSTGASSLLYVGDVLWNGSAISRVFDRRKLVNRLDGTHMINPVNAAGQNLLSTFLAIGGKTNTVFPKYAKIVDEFFADPNYLNRRASILSGHDTDYISNILSRRYTHPQNVYTSRAIEFNFDDFMSSVSGAVYSAGNCNAYLVVYSDENYYLNDTYLNNTYVLGRYCKVSTPQTWSTWYSAGRIVNLDTEKTLFNLDNLITKPDGVDIAPDSIYKFELKIIGNAIGYSVFVVCNP